MSTRARRRGPCQAKTVSCITAPRQLRSRACAAAAWCAAARASSPPSHRAAPAAHMPPSCRRPGSRCARGKERQAWCAVSRALAADVSSSNSTLACAPDCGRDSRTGESVPEGQQALARRGREERRGALVRVPGEQVHLAGQRARDVNQARQVVVGVVDVAQQHVFKEHLGLHAPGAAPRERLAQHRQQLRQRVLAVHRLRQRASEARHECFPKKCPAAAP